MGCLIGTLKLFLYYPYADNLYPKWDIQGTTWDGLTHPTLDTNYLHTDNIKAVPIKHPMWDVDYLYAEVLCFKQS